MVLTQASSNAQDGVSAVQTAEGALTEVHSMLQRMNELAVQAANGTNSQDQTVRLFRMKLTSLHTEIDRVSETTKFNETYLLKGDATKTASKAYFMKSTICNGYKTCLQKVVKPNFLRTRLKEAISKWEIGYIQWHIANAGDQTDANIAEAGKDYVYATKLIRCQG